MQSLKIQYAGKRKLCIYLGLCERGTSLYFYIFYGRYNSPNTILPFSTSQSQQPQNVLLFIPVNIFFLPPLPYSKSYQVEYFKRPLRYSWLLGWVKNSDTYKGCHTIKIFILHTLLISKLLSNGIIFSALIKSRLYAKSASLTEDLKCVFYLLYIFNNNHNHK